MKFTLSARPCTLHKFYSHDDYPVSVKDESGEPFMVLSRDEAFIVMQTRVIRIHDKIHEVNEIQLRRLSESLRDRGIDLGRKQ